VSGGKLQIISDLVAKGANMNVRARNGLSPLGAAVHENKPETVSFLIKQGADVNMPGISYRSQDESDKRLISPLASAAHSGCLEIVQSLVLGGSTLDLEDSRGDTPIMFAARARHPEVVTYLIERGATVNHTGKDGHTALIYAAYQGRMDIVQALLKAGADPACVACDRVGDRITSKYTAADVALQQHYPEIMALLRTEMFKRRNP